MQFYTIKYLPLSNAFSVGSLSESGEFTGVKTFAKIDEAIDCCNELNNAVAPQPTRPPLTPGMSRRDYFAGMALQGAISQHGAYYNESNHDLMVRHSVSMADALIAELDKTQ